MSTPKPKCRAPGCADPAHAGAYYWKAPKRDGFVWAVFCEEHGVTAMLKGASYMKRRPRPPKTTPATAGTGGNE